nr:DUF465 domain-containing protein [Edaphovirga cremea]
MFPEYRELITKQKQENPRFCTLFQEHNRLDHEIKRLEQLPGAVHDKHIIELKREKLRLKDSLYKMLKQCETES